QTELITLLANEKVIIEIAVVDPNTNEILADSSPDRRGEQGGPFKDFRALVEDQNWYDKLLVLRGSTKKFYQLERQYGPSPDQPLLAVRVFIYPAYISEVITPTLKKNSEVAVISVVGAIFVTFLFSAVAFRPLRRLGQQLDRIASGEYEPEK